MPIRNAPGIPAVSARQRWAVSIEAGPDLEYLLGIPSGATDLFTAGAAATASGSRIFSSLQNIGGVEDFDLPQDRVIRERYAFNGNPLEPFQTVGQQVSRTLRLSKVLLKTYAPRSAEKLFSFGPNNILNQQFPFIIQIKDAGDGTPATLVRHLIFGCWFQNTSVKYGVTDREDTKLIQSATVKCGRMLTFDQTVAGSPGALATSTLLGAAVSAGGQGATVLLQNFGLS